MRRLSLIQRVLAAILLPLVLLVSAGPDGILFRCRYDHVARLEPCSPDELISDEADVGDSLLEDRCCEPSALLLIHDSTLNQSIVQPHALLPVLIAAVEPFVAPGLGDPPSTAVGRLRSDTGPPVLLQTRTLLI